MVTTAWKSRDELKALSGDEHVAKYRSHLLQRLSLRTLRGAHALSYFGARLFIAAQA